MPHIRRIATLAEHHLILSIDLSPLGDATPIVPPSTEGQQETPANVRALETHWLSGLDFWMKFGGSSKQLGQEGSYDLSSDKLEPVIALPRYVD